MLVPPARTFSAIVNTATRILSFRFDEAMRNNPIAARAMRRDAFIRGLMEERLLPTINRDWILEIDDDKDPRQTMVRDQLTKIIKSIPDFDAFRRQQLDAVWFGRSGCQWAYVRDDDNNGLWGIPRWDSLHGDSVQFTFDGVPAILLDAMTYSWYVDHGAKTGPHGDIRPTDRGGLALVLQHDYWRDRFAIHRHILEKADFFEGELAGSVQGLGIRGLVYWQYVIRTEALTWMLAYMQSVGQMDLIIFNFPLGNAEAEQRQLANAQKVIGKAAIVCPRPANGNWPAVEQLSMNAAGLKAMHELVSDYFDRHIERLIVGQSMSAGADKGTGLGGTGRAEFTRATKDEILVHDTGRLDCTMTNDLVKKLKKYNFPWARFPIRFKSVMPDLKAAEKTEAGLKIAALISIKADELREAAGYSRPEAGDEVVGGPQPMLPPGMGAPPGMGPPPGPGGPPQGMVPPGPGGPPMLPPGPGMLPSAAYGPHGPPNDAIYPAGYAGDPAGNVPPANGPVMGCAGGSNTYIPGFGNPRRRPVQHDIVGFTRLERGQNPTQYGDQESFDQVIDQNPLDATNHLVYADWLDENGQPDEAAFRRAMGNWLTEHNPKSGYGHMPWIAHWYRGGLPVGVNAKDVSVAKFQDLQLKGDDWYPNDTAMAMDWTGTHGGWHTYRDMEEGLRRAFMTKLQRQREQDQQRTTREGGRSDDPDAPINASRSQNPTTYDDRQFCSTQVNLTGIAAIRVLWLGHMIRDDDLAHNGREQTPHVTLRYGLHENDPIGAGRVLHNVGPIRLRLGSVKSFDGEATGKNYDALYVDVDSKDMLWINRKLGKLKHTETFKYTPHATIACVKKGLGKVYAARMPALDLDWVSDGVVFTTPDEQNTFLPTVQPPTGSGPDLAYRRGSNQ